MTLVLLLGLFHSAVSAQGIPAPVPGPGGAASCPATAIIAGAEPARSFASTCKHSRIIVTHTSRVALLQLRDTMGQDRISGIYLEYPAASQLLLLKAAVPHARNVGVMFSQAARDQYGSLSETAGQTDISLVPIEVPQGVPPARILFPELSRLDAVLVLADPNVLTPSTIKPLLLGTARRYVPMFGGLSAEYVNAGLAGGVFASEASVALQAAKMSGRPGVLPPPAYADSYRIEMNASVGHLLKITPVLELPELGKPGMAP